MAQTEGGYEGAFDDAHGDFPALRLENDAAAEGECEPKGGPRKGGGKGKRHSGADAPEHPARPLAAANGRPVRTDRAP